LSRLRLIFILSLIILVGIFIAVAYLVPSGNSPVESRKLQIIKGDKEWILQCNITNETERDVQYIIHVIVDDAMYKDSVVVKPRKTYTYIHHIYPQQLDEGKVTFALYEGEKAEPVEQATYYIDKD